MPSYSTNLRLVLPTTGEYPGTWGNEVNTGLTNLVDTSIAGTATITMTAADYTLSTANGAADEARAMVLNLTGTPGAARNVICPAVSKLYVVFNNTAGGFAQTVKTASGTGVSVPNGASALLRCDGTNVVEAVNYFGSLSLGTALPVSSGGTGAATLTGYVKGTGTSAFTASSTVPVGDLSGTLPVSSGGTGAATFTANNVLLGNGTSAFQVVAPGTSGNVLTSNGTTWASTALPANVSSISFGTTGLTPSTATTGAVSVAGTLATTNGGTGLTSFTANRIFYASSSSVIAQSAGLTFDGTNFATTGTATATKLVPTGNVTAGNGMYLPAANTVAVSTNGSERIRLTSTGDLFLGYTASVSTNGNTASEFQAHRSGTGNVIAAFKWSNDTNGSALVLTKSRSTTPGSYSTVLDGDEVGSLVFAADDGTDVQTTAAKIAAVVAGTPVSGAIPTKLELRTANVTSPITRAVLTPTGQFVLGENAPQVLIRTQTVTQSTGTSGGQNPYLQVSGVAAGSVGGASVATVMTGVTTSSAKSGLSMFRTRGAATNDYTTVQDNDVLGGIDFLGADGTSWVSAAQIYAEVDGIPGTNDMPGKLVFAVTPAGQQAPVTQLFMESSGSIYKYSGASNPTLPAISTTAITGEIRGLSSSSPTNDNGLLRLTAGGGTGSSIQAGIDIFRGSTDGSVIRMWTNGTERLRIADTSGEVYIAGTTDQGAYNLQVNGTGVWGAGAYVNGSDARLKEDIVDIDTALNVVSALRPVAFRYKPEHSKDQSVQPGFIAQELQTAMAGKPYVDGVVKAGPEYLNVAYQSLIPLLTKAIQEQQAIIEELRSRVEALEAK